MTTLSGGQPPLPAARMPMFGARNLTPAFPLEGGRPLGQSRYLSVPDCVTVLSGGHPPFPVARPLKPRDNPSTFPYRACVITLSGDHPPLPAALHPGLMRQSSRHEGLLWIPPGASPHNRCHVMVQCGPPLPVALHDPFPSGPRGTATTLSGGRRKTPSPPGKPGPAGPGTHATQSRAKLRGRLYCRNGRHVLASK